jgi:serine/threonine-protein kinase
LGVWTVERSLGSGPLCECYLVTRAGNERAVARVLRAPFALDEQFATDWLRACWKANRFQHPRVLRVIEQGRDPRGAPVIVRAWARGETLAQATSRGPLELHVALGLTEQVLDALEIAHAHGILHAAISPSNILVTPRGSVRVVDFGHHAEDRVSMARVGPFSAPERRAVPPEPPSEAADIWSVGACLRFALGASAVQPDVGAVIDLAMTSDPTERYPSAYAMLGDVRRLLGGRTPKLRTSLAPVPSQSVAGAPAPSMNAAADDGNRIEAPASSSGLSEPLSPALPAPDAPAREWRGNLVLVLAIALLAGLATFVLVRERLAETRHLSETTSQTR